MTLEKKKKYKQYPDVNAGLICLLVGLEWMASLVPRDAEDTIFIFSVKICLNERGGGGDIHLVGSFGELK
jgi:hypothetical protein